MDRRSFRWIVALALLTLAPSGPTWAADPKTAPPSEPTAEQRQKMAEVYQKMADCVRSTRPMTECRSEMVAACHSIGGGVCPGMGRGRGGMGPGMMGYGGGPGMMQGPPPTSPPPAPPKQ